MRSAPAPPSRPHMKYVGIGTRALPVKYGCNSHVLSSPAT